VSEYVPGTPPLGDAGRFRLTPEHTAYLRIAEGCSQECRFCTIPAIRGPFRSKPLADVLAEAKELTADGARELNVIAQDTTAWGSDLEDEAGLAGLLRRLDAESGADWIRLLYTYPMRFTDDLIDAIAECECVVPYVDIPLQHIANSVLERMGRGATGELSRRLLTKLRERVEGIAIRTTFMVGYPGETEEEFAELLGFVRAERFEAMGVFAFSPENSTPAAEMDGQVPEDAKAARREALMLAQQEIAFAANEAAIGSDRTVLVDGPDENGLCLARHAGQAPEVDSVCILTEPREEGEFVRGEVVGADGYDLIVGPT
jgi:ribosomal protein S12 methylthiotransferase